eukprot:10498019-Lingulodinium_polyedra.AAC.1
MVRARARHARAFLWRSRGARARVTLRRAEAAKRAFDRIVARRFRNLHSDVVECTFRHFSVA